MKKKLRFTKFINYNVHSDNANENDEARQKRFTTKYPSYEKNLKNDKTI